MIVIHGLPFSAKLGANAFTINSNNSLPYSILIKVSRPRSVVNRVRRSIPKMNDERLEKGGCDREYEALKHLTTSHSNSSSSSNIRQEKPTATKSFTRRQAMKLLIALASMSSCFFSSSQFATASKPEIDLKSGSLFSPKSEMIGGGGSDLARGIKLESKKTSDILGSYDSIPVQYIYETRFILYLSRFLLNYDPPARAWWNDQDFTADGKISTNAKKRIRFAEFAESVEVGLANYFIGPYGSYSSPQAAKAGLLAEKPAQSSSSSIFESKRKTGFFESFKGTFNSTGGVVKPLTDKRARDKARQGILNLFSLLQARYTSQEEKRQIAILFSFFSDPRLQPTRQIEMILGEADNASVTDFKIVELGMREGDQFKGGGYSIYEEPKVIIDSPPALGSAYSPPRFEVNTRPTSRILRIRVLDGGSGYLSPPKVDIIPQKDVKVQCEATAILDRDGSVAQIVVVNPGYGYGKYGGKYNEPKYNVPEVRIAPPKMLPGSSNKDQEKFRQAFAVAELEFAISYVRLVDGGSGYILNQPPKARITPPEEDTDDRKTWKAINMEPLIIEITQMTSKSNGQKLNTNEDKSLTDFNILGSYPSILDNIASNPLALLPSTLQLYYTASGDTIPEAGIPAPRDGNYRILSLPAPKTSLLLPSPRYRAYDPIFGAIGNKPVTKNAEMLTGSEYTRLALSGGVCTVLVRTALNPLELVKTKIQLNSDKELFERIEKQPSPEAVRRSETGKSSDHEIESGKPVSTSDVMKAMISLRGYKSLFQSADITFLASVVFGSFGFGATELFRRSFAMAYMGEASSSRKGSGEELILLAAAAVACVVTSLAAAPFEILRVRSMGYLEMKPVSQVFSDFVVEEREGRSKSVIVKSERQCRTMFDMTKDDIPPLFSGFLPIVSRELPFAMTKFLTFDLVASFLVGLINSRPQIIDPVQIGSGTIGLTISAISGAIAGLAGAVVSHPADLILTLTSAQRRKSQSFLDEGDINQGKVDWKPIVRDLLKKKGGVLNLYAGLPARATFFFLVIGLQFYLYDLVKSVFQVGSDDLVLVLDIFYAIRQGLR